LGLEVLVPEEPLITGALGAAWMGKEIVEKAKKDYTPLKTKDRILKEIKIYNSGLFFFLTNDEYLLDFDSLT